MLTSLRKGAQTWVAAVFIILLAGSFAVWGVADMVGGFTVRDIAKAGDHAITQVDFSRAYESAMQRQTRRFGRRPTRAEARLLGVERQVLGNLVGIATLDAHADDLHLGISDDAVARRIKRDTAFRNLAGEFDANRFSESLRVAGFSEGQFVALQRAGLRRQQITATLTSDVAAPLTFVKALHRFRDETRTVSYFKITPDDIEKPAKPDETELKSYFNANKGRFRAPEYRKLRLIWLRPETLKDSIEVTDTDVRKVFDANPDQYNTPERRKIEQITFPDADAAQKAYDEIKGGKTFDKVADEAGRTDRFIDHGSVTTLALDDKAVARAAFTAEKGVVSEPVKSPLTTSLVRVTEILPPKTRTFDDVKDQIRTRLREERILDTLSDIFDKVEDDRARGLTISDIAGKHNLQLVDIAALDTQGNGKDAKPVANAPTGRAFTQAVFKAVTGVQPEPVELGNNENSWFEVVEIIPPADRKFADTRADVEKRYLEEKTEEVFDAKAKSLTEKVTAGTAIADVAKEMKKEIATSEPLKRETRTNDLPPAALANTFALAKGDAASAAVPGGGRIIFQLTDIKVPGAMSDERRETLAGTIAPGLGQDLISAYIGSLQSRYNVEIDQIAINQATDPNFSRGGGGRY